MKRWSVWLAALFFWTVSLAAQPAPSPATPPTWLPEDAGYVYACTAERRDRHGTLTIQATVSGPAPGDTMYGARWTSAQSSAGLTLSYDLFDQSLRVTDDTIVGLTFEARWRDNPAVRIILSRSGYYGGLGLVFGSDFARAVRGQVGTIVPLGDLRAYADGAPLSVMVMDRRMRVLASERLDPAILEAAVAAPEMLRAEARAMAADYRNRCVRRAEGNDVMI